MKINNLNPMKATGQEGSKFVGIKIVNNQIEFHYPETYCLAEDDVGLRKDILSILRTVSLAKTKTSDMSSYNSIYKDDEVFPLGAFLWIINDYITYGRYENREKIFVSGSKGKINWKRTMHSNPIISKGNIIYNQIISEKKNQVDNLICEIYFFCVQKAIDSIGWLYGISFDPDGVDYYELFRHKKKVYLNALNTELTHTFEDNKKTRLYNMRNIITGLDDELINTRDVIYGVDSYEYVFERMIDKMFSNVKDIKKFYPTADWKLVINGVSEASKLRPDTVMIKDNVVYILDAKYYRYGTTFNSKNMPETTSIQKQITYGEYIKKVHAGKYRDIYSAFILPYSKTDNIYKDRFNKDIEYIGVGEARWVDEKDESKNKKIAALLVDTNFLINNYLRRNEDNIDMLIDAIEKNV